MATKPLSHINLGDLPGPRPVWKGPAIDDMPTVDGVQMLAARFGKYVQLLETMANKLSEQSAIPEWLSVTKVLMEYGYSAARKLAADEPPVQGQPAPTHLPDLSAASDEEVERLAREGK